MANDPYATPLVRREAQRLGVALGAVAGTGVGGRVTIDDVRRAAGPVASAPMVATPVVRTAVIHRASMFDPHRAVDVNEYSANPLLDDARQIYPEKVAAAERAGDATPTLFPSGNLPVFTAAGFDPRLLAPLPWPVRHVAARASQSDAAELLNDYTPGPSSDLAQLASEASMFFGNDEDNRDYYSRVYGWVNAYQYDAATGTWSSTTTYSYPTRRGIGM